MSATSYYNDLESERLAYRKLTEADIEAWSAFFVDNDRTRFVGSERFAHLNNVEKATNWIKSQMERYVDEQNLGQLAVIDKETGNFAGVAGLIVRDLEGEREYEVTYSLLPAFWNRGFASEASQYFKQYAFDNLDCDSVISIIHVENQPSENVAVKNGMRKTIGMEFMDMPVHVFRVDRGSFFEPYKASKDM